MSAVETDIEGTAVEVYTPAQQPSTLFRTDDPVEVIKRASAVAEALKSVIDKQGLAVRINGREHVRIEGWTTCGAMLGVVPIVEWTRQLDRGWEARAIARTLDGRTIGGAESSCSRQESKWCDSDDYAIRGMAQTRASSRALSGPLRWIVTLAGYEGTPVEEMDSVDRGSSPPAGNGSRPSSPPAKPSERPATAKQRAMIGARADAIDLTASELANVLLAAVGEEERRWQDHAGVERWLGRQLDRLPARHVDAVLEGIEAKS